MDTVQNNKKEKSNDSEKYLRLVTPRKRYEGIISLSNIVLALSVMSSIKF